jgi:hypothetical protein
VTCGTLVGSAPVAHATSGTAAIGTPNRIMYSQSDHRKQLEARLSDRAVESLSGTLGAMIGMRALPRQPFSTSREFSEEEADGNHGDGTLDEAQLAALPRQGPRKRSHAPIESC